VGDYFDADGVFHGYVWERGRFRTIDVAGAAGANATDINNRGQITGSSFDDRGLAHGFVLDRGRLTTFDAPNATFTAPFGLNDRGQIVGFSAGDPADITTVRGFLLDRGRFTPINRPGAAVFDINNRRQLVGVAGNPEDQASARPHRHPASGPHGLTTPATH
jgi:hypothetical protein